MTRFLLLVVIVIFITHAKGGDPGISNPKVKWKFKTPGPIRGSAPFAYDEFRRVSAWIKKFNARPGSAFISCRTWGW